MGHSRKTKNGKKLLVGHQLQLTIKQIGTKNEQHGFAFGDYHLSRIFYLTIQQD